MPPAWTRADWTCIRVHESGDQYNSPAAPSGAYGILISTWRSFGYSGWPYEAPPSLQDRVALELYARVRMAAVELTLRLRPL